jgi:general secretion pathway protein M
MNLSASASRSAALAILVGMGVVIWLTLMQPLITSFFDHRESILRSQEMLTRYRGLASTRSQIDYSLRKLHAAQATQDQLLTGGSTQLVGAKLQNSLKESVETSGGSLTSMQLLPVRDEEGFQRVSIAVTLTATIESLQKLIYAIEEQKPYLFIENLELQANEGFMQAANEGANEGEARNLQVHFEVYGYMSKK